MEWQPIETAPQDATELYAKDSDGSAAWTWCEGRNWVRECWRETEDRQEYMAQEYWSPVSYAVWPETKHKGGE